MGHMNDIVMPMHNAPAGAPGPRRSDRVGLTDRVALGTLNKNVLYDRDHRAVAKAHAHAHAGLRHHKPQASLSKCGAPSRPPASPTFLTPRAAGGAQTRTPENVVGRRPTSSLSPAEASPGHASSAKSSQSSASSAEGHPSPFRAPSLTPVAPPSVDKMHDPRLLLPPQGSEHRGKMTVVFDLDETLVSNRRPGASPAIQRHYLKHMCRLLEGLVEVVLWTASTEETGRPVVDQIDPKGTFFHHVVFRSAKWFSSVTHTKDLTLLGRDMERVVIIENTPNCCKLNPQNALMVEDFRGDLRYAHNTHARQRHKHHHPFTASRTGRFSMWRPS